MSTASEVQRGYTTRALAKRDARDTLAEVLYDGDTVYLVERSRSRSGLSATYSVLAVDDESLIVDITEDTATLLGTVGSANRAGYLSLSGDPQGCARVVASGLSDYLGVSLEWKEI